MKKLFFLVAILVALFSCQNETQTIHLKQVDQLIKTTDSIRTVLIENKNDSIMYYISKVMDVEFRIRRSYNSDTINDTFARKLDEYKLVRKKLKPVLKMIGQLEAGTVEELATLQKLKQDIESGAGERLKYNDYLLFEQNKIDELKVILKEIIDVQEKQLAVFNRHHQELYDFSMTLEHVIK
jgi:hypothetical protein